MAADATNDDTRAIERAYCLFHQHPFPERYPAQQRPDLVLHRPPIVAERPGQLLLCACEHDGDHMWPDGDAVMRDA